VDGRPGEQKSRSEHIGGEVKNSSSYRELNTSRPAHSAIQAKFICLFTYFFWNIYSFPADSFTDLFT
jgi:hypothetical protein